MRAMTGVLEFSVRWQVDSAIIVDQALKETQGLVAKRSAPSPFCLAASTIANLQLLRKSASISRTEGRQRYCTPVQPRIL